MMAEYVIRILDKSAEGCDIGVALDKCIAEDAAHENELKDALAFIRKNYGAITKCRRLKDDHTIHTMCWLCEGEFFDAFDALVAAVAEREE